LTSNKEAVALVASIISMVGPILKSVANQIELRELITTCPHILISIKNRGSQYHSIWYDMHRWLLLRPTSSIKLQTSTYLSIGCTYQGLRPAFKPRRVTRSRALLRVLVLPRAELINLSFSAKGEGLVEHQRGSFTGRYSLFLGQISI
jgi:hypothetical protein